jgi:hypothetical protein
MTRSRYATEISEADRDALLAMYAAAVGLIEEALVACEARVPRTAVQKSFHALQDVRKIHAEFDRLKIVL